jgi:hypothetical protein
VFPIFPLGGKHSCSSPGHKLGHTTYTTGPYFLWFSPQTWGRGENSAYLEGVGGGAVSQLPHLSQDGQHGDIGEIDGD